MYVVSFCINVSVTLSDDGTLAISTIFWHFIYTKVTWNIKADLLIFNMLFMYVIMFVNLIWNGTSHLWPFMIGFSVSRDASISVTQWGEETLAVINIIYLWIFKQACSFLSNVFFLSAITLTKQSRTISMYSQFNHFFICMFDLICLLFSFRVWKCVITK